MKGIKSSILVRLCGKVGVLQETLEYYNTKPNKYTGFVGRIVVQKGFETDFASIPRLATPVFTGLGDYNNAAILHDYLYSKGHNHLLNRKECDKIFRHAMAILGVPSWQRNAMYYAVRLFGAKHYKTTI